MDIRSLEKQIYSILDPVVATTLIIADQNAPAPSTSYITIGLTEATQLGQAETTQVDDNGLVSLKINYSMSLEIGGLKSTSKSDVFKLAAYILGSPSVVDSFGSIGLGVNNLSGVSDVPILIQGNIEERSEFTVFLHYIDVYSVDVGFIDKFTTEGTYKNPADVTILTDIRNIDLPD